MPGEEMEVMKTAEHDDHEDFKEAVGATGDSDAAEQGAGAVAAGDGTTASTGVSIAGGLAAGAGASSADGITDDGDAGVPAHEPQPPHTGSGPFPDPPQ